jgi:phage-related protein
MTVRREIAETRRETGARRLGEGADAIARVFFCILAAKRIVMLHSFIKKSDKTPLREREIAEARMKDVKHAHA